MKIMSRHLAPWLFAATCLTPMAAQAGSFFAFGDSLVDNGNIPRVYNVPFSYIEGSLAPYYDNGRFSNGPTWAEILPGLTGLSFSPSNDVAVGGAFAGPLVVPTGPSTSATFNNLSNTEGLPVPLPSFDEEVTNFAAAGGHFGAGDVAGVWVGANNYFIAAQEIGLNPSAATTIVQTAVAQDVGQIGVGVSGLISLGAKTLIVQNLPPLGATPTFNGATDQLNGTTALVDEISSLHNSELSLAMESLHSSTGANIIVVNETQLFNEVLANPSAFGITNTTTACTSTTACYQASTAVQNTYLFWDGVHPTAGIHQFIAEYAAADLNGLRALTAPAQIAADGEAAFSGQLSARMSDLQAGASGFALNLPDHNMVAELGANDAAPEAQVGKLSGFISGGYSYGNRNASPVTSSFNYNVDSFTLGLDDHVAPGIALGAAFGYGDEAGTVQYGSKIKINAYQFGTYATFYQPNFYLNLKFAFGVDSYNNTRPAVLAGSITSKPAGYTYDFGMNTGYVLHRGSYAFGPIAGIDAANAHLNAYTESGDAALTQSVNSQDYSRVIADVGVAASTSLNINGITFNPHISATADEMLSGNGGNFNSVFTDQPGVTLTSTYPTPTHLWAEVQGGVTADLTRRLSLSADFGTTVAKSDGEDHQVSANLRYSF